MLKSGEISETTAGVCMHEFVCAYVRLYACVSIRMCDVLNICGINERVVHQVPTYVRGTF